MYSILLAIEFLVIFCIPFPGRKFSIECNFGHLIFFFFVLINSCRNLIAFGRQKMKNKLLPCKLLLSLFFLGTQGVGSSVAALLHMTQM